MERREIVVLYDIDGTQNIAPPPFKTMFSLLTGKLTIPEFGRPLKPAKPSGMVNLFWHQIRPFTEDSRVGLEIIQQAASETERTIRQVVLSGRDPGLHNMTRQQLHVIGRTECFDEICLSDVGSSSGFKESKAAEEVAKGHSVVLFEDDVAAALRVVRLQEKCQDGQVVWAYLLQNISNHPWLLRRGHLQLPNNIERVSSFQAGTNSLVARIHGGLI